MWESNPHANVQASEPLPYQPSLKYTSINHKAKESRRVAKPDTLFPGLSEWSQYEFLLCFRLIYSFRLPALLMLSFGDCSRNWRSVNVGINRWLSFLMVWCGWSVWDFKTLTLKTFICRRPVRKHLNYSKAPGSLAITSLLSSSFFLED